MNVGIFCVFILNSTPKLGLSRQRLHLDHDATPAHTKRVSSVTSVEPQHPSLDRPRSGLRGLWPESPVRGQTKQALPEADVARVGADVQTLQDLCRGHHRLPVALLLSHTSRLQPCKAKEAPEAPGEGTGNTGDERRGGPRGGTKKTGSRGRRWVSKARVIRVLRPRKRLGPNHSPTRSLPRDRPCGKLQARSRRPGAGERDRSGNFSVEKFILSPRLAGGGRGPSELKSKSPLRWRRHQRARELELLERA